MKCHTALFTILFSAALIPFAAQGQDTLPVIEHFNYSTGLLQNAGGNWIKVSGSTNDLNVIEGNLTYKSYSMSAVGNQVRISSSGTEDDKLVFAAQSAAGTTVYASFLLNVANTTGLGSGDYFAALGNGSSTFSARVYIKAGGTGFHLGLARNTSTVAGWDSTNLSIETTYLIVIGYTMISGAKNDIAKLWINPSLSGSEPPAAVSDSNTTAKDASSIDGFFVRQGSETPNATIDALIIKLVWTNASTGFEMKHDELPFELMLAQNYPNPFNPATTVEFSAPTAGYAMLKVYNLLGQEVSAPFNALVYAGHNNIVLFDGSRLASGVYYYTIEFQPAGNSGSVSQRIVKRMLLVK